MFYKNFKIDLLNGVYDFSSHAIKIALMQSQYTYDRNHAKWSDISEYEITAGNGYTTGGKIITGVVGTDLPTFSTTSDVIWSNSSITAYSAIIYDSTATNQPLIQWLDFGGVQTTSEGNFAISWSYQNNVIILLD